MHLVSIRNNLIQRGKQLISLNDMGSLNQKIQFSGGMGRGRPQSKHKNERIKVQNDIRTSTHEQTNIPNFQLCYP